MSLSSRLAILSSFFLLPVHSASVQGDTLPRTGFTIHQVANPHFVANGSRQLQAAYAKYHSLSVQIANESSSSPSYSQVTTPTTSDAEYLSPVDISGQQLVMNFDTGSSDFWVFSTELPDSEQAGHTCFDASETDESNFSLLSGFTFAIEYGDGSMSQGPVGLAAVNISGAIVSSQAIGLASSVSPSIARDTKIDGLLGFGWSNRNSIMPQRQLTWFDNIKSSLALPVFTADLKYHAPGSYDFGWIDESKFDGPLYYEVVDHRYGYWMFQGDGYAIGQGEFIYPDGGLRQIIVDTGTTLLLLKQDLVDAYYAQVTGSMLSQTYGSIVFPCRSALPDLRLQFGDYIAVLPAKYMIYGQISRTDCYGALQAGPPNLNVLGDIFFKSQFVVFNGDDAAPSVGFAPKSATG